jgi:PEP-CTERM motif
VSGFFFRSSLPPNELVASGSSSQSITNNFTATLPLFVDFFIPAPTLQFQNVGNSFPSGADPDRDAFAIARITLSTILTRPDGTTVEKDLLDYGVRSFREPSGGVFTALPIGAGTPTRFFEVDSFGFRMPDLAGEDFSIGEVAPGETLEFTYDYFVQGKTGFGETGVFAAIGDPFSLGAGGGRFNLQLGAVPPTPSVPEPGTFVMLGLGLVAMSRKVAHRARRTW